MFKKVIVFTIVLAAVCVGIVNITRTPKTQEEKKLILAKKSVVLASIESHHNLSQNTVDYPIPGTVFPPEIVAPTVLWHEQSDKVDYWLIEVSLPTVKDHLYILSDGRKPDLVIDPKAVSENNAWKEDEYQASAKGWTPDSKTWELMKRFSTEHDLALTIWGLTTEGEVVSSGNTTFGTSTDPVGAPIFYRDVPLMPSQTKEGFVQPLSATAIPLIKWRLRDISKASAPVVMRHMPTCINCHSFSADGKTLAVDVDSPTDDKGAHTVQDVNKSVVIEDHETFSWNDFDSDPSYGLFPRVSPDGQHVAATVKESVYVQNYADFRFLQTFYPTRGIIAIYNRKTKKITALPGADDSRYVQTNPAWTPDGTSVVFLRALARDSYPSKKRASYANDPKETQIKYDLWRVPFNNGKGGKASPIVGASANGKSNSFPAFSPDGKWLVYVQCENGLLMRPDSRLFIVPSAGGQAREMNCNTRLMNSWHTWSPNSRWLAFASKSRRPFTQIFLTHVDENGNDTPAVLLPGSTADNRAANLPEFANIAVDGIVDISSPAVEYRRLFETGKKHIEAGNIVEAHKVLKKSLKLKNDYPQSLITMGYTLNCLQRQKEAIPYFRRALSLDSNQAEAHQQWGNALFEMRRLDEAMEQYNLATQINSRHALAHSMLAKIHMKKGNTVKALERFAMAVEANPARPKSYCYWALALMQTGQFKDAEDKLKKCLEFSPNYVHALELLGQILAKTKKLEEALQKLQRVVVLEPKRVSTRKLLARILSHLGRPNEALEHLRIACEITPSDHLVLTEMGGLLAHLGKHSNSIPYFRRALKYEAGNDRARNGLAWALATHPIKSSRDGAEATRHAELACRNTRWGNPIFMRTLAASHAENGDFKAAVDICKKALKIAQTSGNKKFINEIRNTLILYEQVK